MLDPGKLDKLAREVQAGRLQSFDDIVKETASVIRSVVRFLISDDDLADDVVQETYILIYREIDRYTPGTDLLAWAKAVARTQALSARFRRGRKQVANARYRMEVLDRITQDFDEEEKSDPIEEQIRRLWECLNALPEKARSMVDSRYFRHQSMDDVAKELGMKPGAATVTLHRIRAALLKCMEMNGVPT